MTRTLVITPLKPPEVSTCNYCGQTKRLFRRVKDLISREESFTCFQCSSNGTEYLESLFPGPFDSYGKKRP